MKLFAALLILSALLAGCGGNSREASVNNSSTPPETKKTEAATPTPTATPTPATTETEQPVEFTYLGITPDKEAIAYKIKVKTIKPISQVDLSVRYLDGGGKVMEETTIAWQNVVKSVRKPIEQGKTYEAEGYLPEGATKAEVALKRVIFADGTRWENTN